MKKMFGIKTAYRLLLIAFCLFLLPKISQAVYPVAARKRLWLFGFLFAFIIIFASFSYTSSANGATYYVATTGSDTNSGSTSAPFKTIQKAADVAQAGDTVHVKSGTYNERVSVKNSGTFSNPITFEGERGSNGDWLTTIDGGDATSGWVKASEIGPYVYKTTNINYRPYAMTAMENGQSKKIHRLLSSSSDIDPYEYLNKSPDATVTTFYNKSIVKYWDSIEAVFYYDSGTGTTYVRFRSGDNPATRNVKSSASATVLLGDKSYITFKNFLVRGGRYQVEIYGTNASNNIMEENYLINGDLARLYIHDGAFNNRVRKNKIQMGILGSYTTGAWQWGQNSSTPYIYGVKENFYNRYKTEFDSDAGIKISSAGQGNEIHNNDIFEGLLGISIGAVSGLKVHDNAVHGFSSVGIIPGGGLTSNVEIYDNLFSDSNINLRIHRLDEYENRSTYLYRNRFYLPTDIGEQVYFHWETPSSTPSDYARIYFYHNSFAGGRNGIGVSSWGDANGGLPKSRFINNIISSKYPWTYLSNPEIFDYNWIGGSYSTTLPSWVGPNNIIARTQKMWDETTMPNFSLPATSNARSAGIDLSKTFIINGKTYPALPGMQTGYFSGSKPDLGAVQYSGSSPDTTPPSPPTNVRVN
jgi:hypothetical protein